jgi:creatinine amidohydrolase
MVKAGFKNILVLNGHGGNVIPCQAAWDQFVREFQVNVQFMSYWDVLNEEDAQLLRSGQRIPEDLPGHAQEFETSIALARFPDNVRAEAMAEQADQAPAMATSELGEQMLTRIVQRLSQILEDMISGARTQPIPPFQP